MSGRPRTHHATALLLAWTAGDEGALDRLTRLVYEKLRDQARRHMRRERAGHTLQATALVNAGPHARQRHCTDVDRDRRRPPSGLVHGMDGPASSYGALDVVGASRRSAKNYLPEDVYGMVHRAYLSPNRNWVLLIEMDASGWVRAASFPLTAGHRGGG